MKELVNAYYQEWIKNNQSPYSMLLDDNEYFLKLLENLVPDVKFSYVNGEIIIL